jgi:glyoxylase I family protein
VKRDRAVTPGSTIEGGGAILISPSRVQETGSGTDRTTQEAIEKRIKDAGYKDPDTFVLEHGYCRSVYIKDPNGLILEFTLDAPNADQIAQDRMADAPATLARWLSGDHTSNNTYR